MVLTDAIRAKLYSYFTQRLRMIEYTRGWIQGDCPYCGKEKKFGVQLDDNRAHCFSCDIHTKPLSVVFARENLNTYRDVTSFLNTFQDIKIFNTKNDTINTRDEFKLPDEFRLVGLYDSQVAKIVENNLKGRGFNIRKLMKAGVGYCASGKYAGRIIIPYYQNAKLVYFNARKFVDLGEKFKNPSEEEAGIGKSKLIYNIDAIYLFTKAYIFESATNSLTMGDNGTGTGGKSLSIWQKNQYLTAPCERYVIGLDDDAQKLAYKLSLELIPHKKVKVLEFPEGKDANVLGFKATKELEKNTPYLKNYKEAYKKYLNA